MFIAQAHLDHIMHKHGIGSREFDNELNVINLRIKRLWEGIEGSGGGELWIISDHGMAQVNHPAKFPGELLRKKKLCKSYFIDATMVRIWGCPEKYRQQLNSALESLPGKMLTEQERSQWGIESELFGDIIFLLEEGYMFAPSFVGDEVMKSMHGYWPDLPSQQGVLLTMEKGAEAVTQPASALEAYRLFKTKLFNA